MIADISFASCSRREISRKFRGRRRHVPYDFLSSLASTFVHRHPPTSMSTINDSRFETLVKEIEDLIINHFDEHELTSLVADQLRIALADGINLPASVTRPHTDSYVMYPLHIDPTGRFCIASAVWNIKQETPIHSHETWGVVGIHSGVEHEISFKKPQEGEIPEPRDKPNDWKAGQVTVCCTTDNDVHKVNCGSSVPCVGIHIYGADIGKIRRRAYNEATGKVTWFTTTWAHPEE